MRVLNFDPNDIETVRQALAHEIRALEKSDRAKDEGRVANERVWIEKLAERRRQIRRLEQELAELIAAEESAAELSEEYRAEDAA